MNPLNSRGRYRASSGSRKTTGGVLGRRHRPDYFLIIGMSLLLSIGLMVIYSVSPAISAQLAGDVDPNHFMYRQVFNLLIGISAFMVASLIPLEWWTKLQKFILIAAVISFLLLFIPFFSLNYGGASRWVTLHFISYQPAELLKLGLVFALGLFFARRIREGAVSDWQRTLGPFLVIFGLIALEIVLIQRDMGTMIPIAGIMMAILWLSGVKKTHFASILVGLAVAGAVMIIAAPHRMARVATFLNPESGSASSWHINQSLIAIGSGGWFGKGLGRSVQAYGYLPEASNDSIFAIIAEKFGFFGVLAVFAIYGMLLARILRVVKKAPNAYLRLVAGGIFAWIAIQAFVNVSAMIGLMPLTGVTLPLLSFGGTSLAFSLVALGVIFNISRYTKLGHERDDEESQNSTSRRRVGRPRYAA